MSCRSELDGIQDAGVRRVGLALEAGWNSSISKSEVQVHAARLLTEDSPPCSSWSVHPRCAAGRSRPRKECRRYAHVLEGTDLLIGMARGLVMWTFERMKRARSSWSACCWRSSPSSPGTRPPTAWTWCRGEAQVPEDAAQLVLVATQGSTCKDLVTDRVIRAS